MIYAAIVACEIGFWVLLLAGLATRYLARRRRAGAVLLAGVPLIDVALLAFSVVDLRADGVAATAHGLAAVYIGVSVAFGHRMMRWADERFAYRFAGGPPPSRPPKYGRDHARHERSMWYRSLSAWALGCALLFGGVAVVAGTDWMGSLVQGDMGVSGELERVGALLGVAGVWTLVLLIDFVWSFSYSLWPRRQRRSEVSA